MFRNKAVQHPMVVLQGKWLVITNSTLKQTRKMLLILKQHQHLLLELWKTKQQLMIQLFKTTIALQLLQLKFFNKCRLQHPKKWTLQLVWLRIRIKRLQSLLFRLLTLTQLKMLLFRIVILTLVFKTTQQMDQLQVLQGKWLAITLTLFKKNKKVLKSKLIL